MFEELHSDPLSHLLETATTSSCTTSDGRHVQQLPHVPGICFLLDKSILFMRLRRAQTGLPSRAQYGHIFYIVIAFSHEAAACTCTELVIYIFNYC